MDQTAASVVLPAQDSNASTNPTVIIQVLYNCNNSQLLIGRVNELTEPSDSFEMDPDYSNLYSHLSTFFSQIKDSNIQILYSFSPSLISNYSFIQSLIEFSFHQLRSVIAISICSTTPLSSFGCNVENCLLFEFNCSANQLNIFPVVNYKSYFTSLSFSLPLHQLLPSNQNELLVRLKNEIFPLIFEIIFTKIELEKRQLVCENIIITGLTKIQMEDEPESQPLSSVQSIELREFLLRELDLYFCNSPLAADNQPQDFALAKLPDYFSSLKDKHELVGWIGGCIYSKVVFTDSKFFLSLEEYRSEGIKLHKKYFLK